MTTRRDFLKACAAAGAFAPGLGLGRLAFAADGPAPPLLVLVFQRGGCDGLNLVGPANEKAYVEARPPELRVLDGGERPGLALANGLADGIDFRLHPEAAPLFELYQGGRLAVLHACGLQNATRSHFEAQDLIERGVVSVADYARTDTGWLTRYLATLGEGAAAGRIAALSANAGVSAALARFDDALAAPDLAGGLPLAGGREAAAVLGRLYPPGATDPVRRAGAGVLARSALVEARLPRLPDGRPAPYAPAGAAYDNNGFTQGLQAIARLARMDVGLRVACIDHASWDTHDAQPGRFNALVGTLARGLAAFHQDMAAAGRPVRVVVMTEFGRRLRANRSQGTDHGHGSAMLVLGDGVRGGRMFGAWPGLDTPRLDQGVDLAATTDHRPVLAELLTLSGRDQALVFPGLPAPAPLGLLA
jgi:uncharacterized protein (DUF1501 family)